MGGMTLGKSAEQMMREREAINAARKEDPADVPMKGNRLSPKEQYKAIKRDIEFVSGRLPYSQYGRAFPLGTSASKAKEIAEEDLRRDSDVGRYAEPGYGDAGQFFKKGGKVKGYAKGGVTRADGCAQRGKTKGRMV